MCMLIAFVGFYNSKKIFFKKRGISLLLLLLLLLIDRDYKDSNIRTEEARLSWESSMYRCCRHLEGLERVRLEEVSSAISKYTQIMLTIVSPLQEVEKERKRMY